MSARGPASAASERRPPRFFEYFSTTNLRVSSTLEPLIRRCSLPADVQVPRAEWQPVFGDEGRVQKVFGAKGGPGGGGGGGGSSSSSSGVEIAEAPRAPSGATPVAAGATPVAAVAARRSAADAPPPEAAKRQGSDVGRGAGEGGGGGGRGGSRRMSSEIQVLSLYLLYTYHRVW